LVEGDFLKGIIFHGRRAGVCSGEICASDKRSARAKQIADRAGRQRWARDIEAGDRDAHLPTLRRSKRNISTATNKLK